MSHVTTHYGITGPVPFVNVRVDQDIPIFVDPSAIRNDKSLRGRAAYSQLQAMFAQVVEAAKSTNPMTQAAGRQLLTHLHEPNETRLGLSAAGSRGKGFGHDLETQFWSALRTNSACQNAVVHQLEDTRLYLDHVGDDRISDMTTRIVFNVLAEFTTEMMDTYPTLGVGATKARMDTWTNETGWKSTEFELPYCAGRQLLLVPDRWVYWRTLMDPVQFYNRFSTQVIQDESAAIDGKGKRHVLSKKSIKEANPAIRPLNNSKAVEYKVAHSRDLTEEYRSWIDANYEVIAPEQLSKRTGVE